MGFTANLAAVQGWQPLFLAPAPAIKYAIEGKLRIIEKLYQAGGVFYRKIVEAKLGKIQKRW
ncbi:MAG: hypothetical protein GX085_07850 [Firmicutes bacterium]|nr:hypothetical protein [Bacillota bacterium]